MEEETNMELNEMYQELGISPEVLKFGTEILFCDKIEIRINDLPCIQRRYAL